MNDLLDMAGVARHLGVTPTTIRGLRSRGLMPEPDAIFGRSPVWHVTTIDEWHAGRPIAGRNARLEALRNPTPDIEF